MARRVVFHPRAQRELTELYDYIAEHGGPQRAAEFIDSIRDYCLGFSTFPERGAKRDDLATGVRVVGFRRRISIAFAIEAETVWILGIFYGGRNVVLSPGDDVEDDAP